MIATIMDADQITMNKAIFSNLSGSSLIGPLVVVTAVLLIQTSCVAFATTESLLEFMSGNSLGMFGLI